MGDPPSRAGLAHRSKILLSIPRVCQSYGLQKHMSKGHWAPWLFPKALGPSPPTALALTQRWFSVSFLFSTSQPGQEKTVLPPISSHVLVHLISSLSATLLWTAPESSLPSLSIPLGSQGSLRMIHLEVLWRRHWGKKNITNPEEFKIRAQGWNLCPQIWLLLVFFSSGGMTLLEASWLSSFISSFIHSTKSTYDASDAFTQGISRSQMETTAMSSWKHAFPSEISMCPAPRSEEDKRWVCLLGFSSHCPSNHQIPFTKSGSHCALNIHHLLCRFVFKDSLISVGHPHHPLFIFSTHIPNEALFPRSGLVGQDYDTVGLAL